MRLLSLLLCAAVEACAQSPSTPVAEKAPVQVLSASSRISLNVPMFGAWGKTLCDASGNLYSDLSFMASRTGLVRHDVGPFLEIDADGSHHQIYRPQLDGKTKADTLQGVSPDGTFYILVESETGAALQKFDRTGNFQSSDPLEIPQGVHILYWAIQNDGVLFLMGYAKSQTPSDQRVQGYYAILTPQGKVRSTLEDIYSKAELKSGITTRQEGDVIAGDDGMFYVSTSDRMFVISQSGEVQRVIHFSKPAPDASPTRIDVQAGTISLVFYTPKDHISHMGALDTNVTLLDAQTGDEIRSFVFADTTTKSVLCYRRNEGYSLAAVDHGIEAVDIVPAR